MGAQSFARGAEVPPQPPTWSSSGSKPRKDDFSSAYAPVTNGAGSSRNPFEVYDADLDDAGADTGTPRFYSSYFDVNVGDICARLVRSIIPFKPLLGWAARDEEEDNGTSVPDLYGPVWVTTTAVLALSVGSSVAHFLSNLFHGTEANDLPGSLAGLDFSRLWRAASVLYFYVFVFPIILTVFQCLFVRRSLRESSVASHPVLGTIMVYGYSMTPVVVAAMVAAVPIKLVQVVSMGIAFTIGVLVILLNLWRDVGVEHRSLTYFVRGLAGVAHAGVGSGLIFMFYVHR
jgi:hypothetical protein